MQIALAFLALFLPGTAWYLWFGDHEQDGGEALARIFAVSFGTIAGLCLAFFAIRLPLTPVLFVVLVVIFAAAVIAGLIRNYKTAFNKTWLLALLVLGVFVAWRLWQAKDLLFPNWVDSQHHVLIIRKMLEAGMLPPTLEPYLPGPFYYHFAFHAVAAVFTKISGLPIERSVLLFGQVMNAMVGFAIYAMVKIIGRDWRIALLAAFLITFVTKMPGYYLSWGRYTLLIGVILMMVAVAEAEWLRRNGKKWQQTIGLTILVCGTLLSHYLTAFLLAAYLVLLGIEWIIQSVKDKHWVWKDLLMLLVPSAAAFLFSLRWYARIFRYSASFVSTSVYIPDGALKLDAGQLDYFRYVLGPKIAYALLALALAGLVWAFFHREWRKLAVWSIFITIFAVPVGIMLFSFRSDYYGLIMFCALGSLSAAFLVWSYDALSKKIPWKKTFAIICLVLVLGFIGWGAWRNTDAINDSTILVTNLEADALDWIENHTPADARFFVNTTSWGYGLYRGSDAGGWILPRTGRWSLAPTTFYPYGADQNTSELWTDWAKRASKVSSCGTDFWELIDEAQLNYVYLRDGAGSLSSQALLDCDGLTRLYQNEGVSIWLIKFFD
jgi:hypothetical protein